MHNETQLARARSRLTDLVSESLMYRKQQLLLTERVDTNNDLVRLGILSTILSW